MIELITNRSDRNASGQAFFYPPEINTKEVLNVRTKYGTGYPHHPSASPTTPKHPLAPPSTTKHITAPHSTSHDPTTPISSNKHTTAPRSTPPHPSAPPSNPQITQVPPPPQHPPPAPSACMAHPQSWVRCRLCPRAVPQPAHYATRSYAILHDIAPAIQTKYYFISPAILTDSKYIAAAIHARGWYIAPAITKVSAIYKNTIIFYQLSTFSVENNKTDITYCRS